MDRTVLHIVAAVVGLDTESYIMYEYSMYVYTPCIVRNVFLFVFMDDDKNDFDNMMRASNGLKRSSLVTSVVVAGQRRG